MKAQQVDFFKVNLRAKLPSIAVSLVKRLSALCSFMEV